MSLKEVMLHLEDYARQSSLRLLEAKNEVRAQHASTITSIKEVTSAIKSLDTAIRLGTEQNQSMSTGGAHGRRNDGTPGSRSNYECSATESSTNGRSHHGHTGHPSHIGCDYGDSSRGDRNPPCAGICLIGLSGCHVSAKCTRGTSVPCPGTYAVPASA